MNEHVTAHHPFGPCEGDMPILAVRQGMPLEEALTQARLPEKHQRRCRRTGGKLPAAVARHGAQRSI